MRSTEEQAVARALQSLVTEAVVPSALAGRVERRYRRRRTAAAGGVLAALVVGVLAVVLVPAVLSRWISPAADSPAAHATTSSRPRFGMVASSGRWSSTPAPCGSTRRRAESRPPRRRKQ